MIGQLRGTLLEKKPNRILIDVGGVGYEVQVPLSTYYKLPSPGSEVRLLIHTYVREDTLTLFGFETAPERELFECLLGVTGIGPRLALNVLSNFSPEHVVAAVKRNNPVALVARGTGIGHKTAERIVYALRERIPVEAAAEAPAGVRFSEVAEEVVSGLVNMGCERKLAEQAVSEVLESGVSKEEFEPLMKQALRWLREKKR